jgi:hypothetical protein
MANLEALYQTEMENSLSVVSPILPMGDYLFYISKLPEKLEIITDKTGKDRVVFRPQVVCSDPPDTKRYLPLTLFISLDLTPEGLLDSGEGMNVDLGRLREAVGQNEEGVAWNFSMLLGQQFAGTIVHGVSKTTGEKLANVRQVRPVDKLNSYE